MQAQHRSFRVLHLISFSPSMRPVKQGSPASLFYKRANHSSAQFIQRANKSEDDGHDDDGHALTGCLENKVRSHPITSGAKASSWGTDRKPSRSFSKLCLEISRSKANPIILVDSVLRLPECAGITKSNPAPSIASYGFDTIHFHSIIHSNLLTVSD